MTYGRVQDGEPNADFDGAAVSHLAELVRGDLNNPCEGPLIRPFGAPRIKSRWKRPSPRGEKGNCGSCGEYLEPARLGWGR